MTKKYQELSSPWTANTAWVDFLIFQQSWRYLRVMHAQAVVWICLDAVEA